MIAALALAATLPVVDVTSSRGLYTVRVDARVAAPPAAVWRALTDYGNLSRLSGAIRTSRIVERTVDGALVDTVTRTCHAAVFCRTLRHRQRVVERPPGLIVAVTDPAHSDFSEGTAEWRLTADGAQTLLQYRMTVRPAVFVPPLVGPPLVRRALDRESAALIRGIERAVEAADR